MTHRILTHHAVLLILISLLLSLMSGTSQAQTEDIYGIGRIEQVDLESNYFDFERRILVSLPPAYDLFSVDDYDVIYVLDAQTTALFYVSVGLPDFIPQRERRQFIVVGICSPQTEKYNRNNDFLPNDSLTIRLYHGNAGSSSLLTRFIQEELQPYIDSHYRTSGYRIAIGHSNGASFILNDLVTQHIFDDYIALSPNFSFSNQLLAQKFTQPHSLPSERSGYLFISHAGEKGKWKTARDRVYQFIDRVGMAGRYYTERDSIPQYGHWDSFPMALRSAYTRYFTYRDSVDLLPSKELYAKQIEVVTPNRTDEIYLTVDDPSHPTGQKKMKMIHVNDSIRRIEIQIHLPGRIHFFDKLGNQLMIENSYYENPCLLSTHRKSYKFRLSTDE